MKCLVCGGVCQKLGQLALKLWFRCRDCGMTQSQQQKEDAIQ